MNINNLRQFKVLQKSHITFQNLRNKSIIRFGRFFSTANEYNDKHKILWIGSGTTDAVAGSKALYHMENLQNLRKMGYKPKFYSIDYDLSSDTAFHEDYSDSDIVIISINHRNYLHPMWYWPWEFLMKVKHNAVVINHTPIPYVQANYLMQQLMLKKNAHFINAPLFDI